MGSPPNEEGRFDDETQHEVTLTQAYWLGTTEVTQSQWEKVMGSNPSAREFQWWDEPPTSLLDPLYPVHSVTWCDAVVFANKLSENDGLAPVYGLPGGMSAGLAWGACNELALKVTVNAGADGYRLPTESEWERAARGGTEDRWAGTDRASDLCGVANIADTSAKERFGWDWEMACDDRRDGLAPVGSYMPNAYGLKDMTGKVLEWTWDAYGPYPTGSVTDPTGATEGPYRVRRGGSWNHHFLTLTHVFGTAPRAAADDARVAQRKWQKPDDGMVTCGLRLSRTIPAP